MNGVRPALSSCLKVHQCDTSTISDDQSSEASYKKFENDTKEGVCIADSRENNSEISESAFLETFRKSVTFDRKEGDVMRNLLPGYLDGGTSRDICNEKKCYIKSSVLRSEIRYGRAVSQPEETDEVRLARFENDSVLEEGSDNGSIIPSAYARRTQRNSRRRNNHSLYGVSPHCKFGPKGYLVSSSACSLTIPDPSNQKLSWTKPPLTVLIIRKHLDESVLVPFRDLVIWLMEEKNMVVFVEQMVLEERVLLEDERFQQIQDKLKSFRDGVDDLTDKVDFIICLGGDGTLLYVSSLFQGSVPPVMAFNMGSLGFLTPFQFYQDFKNEVTRVMQGSASLLLRFRLKCVVVKHDTASVTEIPHVKNIQKEHVSLKSHKLVLNEVVIDRGSSSYLSNLDLFIEGRRVTTVQGDGLIISTPTGSTAYAVAAGASMIHPSVPCILITPICPHSLSFRPIVVPAGVEIKVMLSPGARSTAMASFDGRDRQEIHQGDSLRITTASYPVPSICAADQIEDWFDGLSVCLNWNLRLPQQPLHISSSITSIESFDSDYASTPVPTQLHLNSAEDRSLNAQRNSAVEKPANTQRAHQRSS